MIEGLHHFLPEKAPRVSQPSQIRFRLLATTAAALTVLGCSVSPEPRSSVAPSVPRRVSDLTDSAPPALTDSEIQAEKLAFRQVLLQGRMIRQQVARVAEIQEAFKTVQEDAKESLALELTQASFDLEVAAFNLFGDIRRTNPRCWARLLRVLRAVTDGTVRVENVDDLTLEQFGLIEHSSDTPVSRKAVSGLYTEQVKFLALMVARLDRNMAELRRQFDAANPAEREHLQSVIHALERQQSDLMELIEGGDIFPISPTETERASWEQRIFDVFRETRQRSGGREGIPKGLRFGGGEQPSSNQIQPLTPLGPSEIRPSSPAPAPAVPQPSVPRQPEEEPPAAPQPDYRPRVV